MVYSAPPVTIDVLQVFGQADYDATLDCDTSIEETLKLIDCLIEDVKKEADVNRYVPPELGYGSASLLTRSLSVSVFSDVEMLDSGTPPVEERR